MIKSTIALMLSIMGNVFINEKHVILGYYVWIISNILWVIVGLTATDRNIPQILMYVLYTVLNIRGIFNWRKTKKPG